MQTVRPEPIPLSSIPTVERAGLLDNEGDPQSAPDSTGGFMSAEEYDAPPQYIYPCAFNCGRMVDVEGTICPVFRCYDHKLGGAQ